MTSIGNQLRISKPSEELLVWCKKNLVLINPEYAKKQRMGFWTGNTPKTISLYEINGDWLVLPVGAITLIPTNLLKTPILTDFVTHEPIDFKADVPLYDYQEKAVDAMAKVHYGILQSPAGSGKTQMGIALAAKLSKKTLWLCHTKDLLEQSKKRAELYMDKSLIGTITEGKVNIGKAITFATIQTMCRLNLPQYRDEWDCIITDEVHRVAGTPTAVTQYSKVLNSLAARHKYGLSATVHRSDGLIMATYALVGKVMYQVSDEEVEDKIIKVGIMPIDTEVKPNIDMLNTDGTMNHAKMISSLVSNEERNNTIVTMIVSSDRPSLILSDRLEHLKTLIDMLPANMIQNSVMISGKTPKAEREKALDEMRIGYKDFLFATYSLAKEGLDVPRLEYVHLATPHSDYAVITQAIGRVARTCDGKTKATCIDYVDPFLYKHYKKRCTHYRKARCYFIGGDR